MPINETVLIDLTLKNDKFNAGLNNAQNASQSFEQALQKTNQKLTKMLIEMKKISSRSAPFNKAEKSAKKFTSTLTKARKGLASFNAGFVALGAAAGGFSFFTNAIQGARDFDKAMREVITIVPDGSKTMEELSKEVEDVALLMGEDAPKAARAMYQAISAGVDAKKAKSFLLDASVLAKAGVTTLENSVDLLAGTLNAYGIDIENAGALSDSFFKTVEVGVITVAELTQAMGKISPLASNAGVSIIEVEAALATMTSQNIKANIASTALTSALSSIIKPADSAIAKAREIGFDFSVTALKAKGLAGFMKELKEKTGGNIEVMAQLIPNVNGLNAVLALTSEQGAKKFNKSLKVISDSSGAAAKAAKKIGEGFDFQFGVMESAAKQGAAGVGKSLVAMIFDFDQAGNQSGVISLKIKSFFKKVEVGIGFLINQVFRRAIVGMKFLGSNAVNVAKTLADAFNIGIAEIKVAFLELQIAANKTMEFLGIVDEDVEFGKSLVKELKKAEKAAKRSLGDVAKDAVKRFDVTLKEMGKGLDEIKKKQKIINKAALDSVILDQKAAALSKEIAKAAKAEAKARQDTGKALTTNNAKLEKQKAIQDAVNKALGKKDFAEREGLFTDFITAALDDALSQGVKTSKIQALSDFVRAKLDQGMPIEEIKTRFNQKLNDALDVINKQNESFASKESRRVEREQKKAERELEKELKDGLKEATKRGVRGAADSMAQSVEEAFAKAFGGVGALKGSGGQISNVVATRSFQSEQKALEALRRSNEALRRSPGFNPTIGITSQVGISAKQALFNRQAGLFHDGGIVGDPAGSRDKTIIAQEGEVVINRQSAQAFLPLLQAINRSPAPPIVNNNVDLGGVTVNNAETGITNEVIDNVIIPRIAFQMRMQRFG